MEETHKAITMLVSKVTTIEQVQQELYAKVPSNEAKAQESESEASGRSKSAAKSKQRSPTRGKSSGAPVFGRKRSK